MNSQRQSIQTKMTVDLLRSFSIFFFFLRISNATDLCQKYGDTHTMCLPDKNCNTASPLTEDEKQAFVDEHNKLRQKIANGLVNPQPRAANMQIMKWNEDLALVAQKWANNCFFGHDKNRVTEEFETTDVGQNVFIAKGIPPPQLQVQVAVRDWFEEHKNFDSDLVGSPTKSNQMTGHYTQVAWADTTDVGCGYSKYKTPDMDALLVVCNYGPAGNVIGRPMYKVGVACSACEDKCSVKYDGLCDPKEGVPKMINFNDGERITTGFHKIGFQLTVIFCASNGIKF